MGTFGPNDCPWCRCRMDINMADMSTTCVNPLCPGEPSTAVVRPTVAKRTIGERAEFLRAGGYTRRYHGWRLIKDDLVGGHSYNVANIVLLLRPDCSKELLVACIQHDAAEHICGDTPSTAKRRVPALKVELDKFEDEVFAEHGLANVASELSPEDHHVLKLADYLDGMMFCIQERQMGNQLAAQIYPNFKSYMGKLLYPNADVKRGTEHQLFDELVDKWDKVNGKA